MNTTPLNETIDSILHEIVESQNSLAYARGVFEKDDVESNDLSEIGTHLNNLRVLTEDLQERLEEIAKEFC